MNGDKPFGDRLKETLIGKPRNIKDPTLFHKLALIPILAWIGDALALVGGLVATTGLTDMTVRAYVTATLDAITPGHFLTGLSKTPFLAVAIGMIACGQGLATRGGAAAVGARTTTAVVMAIFGVIVISALFTFVYAVAGV